MNIPFSPPLINESVFTEVKDTLESGWITSGPKVKALEEELAKQIGVKNIVCVNSWSSGAILVLKWLGIGPGDEVILPAYTYCATALSVIHCGAKVVMVDVSDDFTIDPQKIEDAITSNTKAIFAVDFAGLMCNYDDIFDAINRKVSSMEFSKIPNRFHPQFKRPVLLSDAAHSIGASYKGKKSGSVADLSIFSLHAVKNITTAEGGAISFNLPETYNPIHVEYEMKLWRLNGQTKDALSKTTSGDWRYDILFPGFKINMPDICAAIGLAQLRDYEKIHLVERKRIAQRYQDYFSLQNWAITPTLNDSDRISCFHIYPLRIKGFSEAQRDKMILNITSDGIAVNVHFIPLPSLTVFKNMGFDIADFPMSYSLYENEISLPIYPQLTNDQVSLICETVTNKYFELSSALAL